MRQNSFFLVIILFTLFTSSCKKVNICCDTEKLDYQKFNSDSKEIQIYLKRIKIGGYEIIDGLDLPYLILEVHNRTDKSINLLNHIDRMILNFGENQIVYDRFEIKGEINPNSKQFLRVYSKFGYVPKEISLSEKMSLINKKFTIEAISNDNKELLIIKSNDFCICEKKTS